MRVSCFGIGRPCLAPIQGKAAGRVLIASGLLSRVFFAATVLAVLFFPRGFQASAAEAQGGKPGAGVETKSEKPGYRTVDPEEVRRALEKIRVSRGESTPPNPASPLVPAPPPKFPQPIRATPVPFVWSGPSKPKPIAIPMPRLGRVGDPDVLAPPAWAPDWDRKRLSPQWHGKGAQVRLEYKWRGIVADVSFHPLMGSEAPTRLFFNRSSVEILEIPAGNYRVEIKGWSSGRMASVSLYQFDGVEFRRGYSYTLRFDDEQSEELTAYFDARWSQMVEHFSGPAALVFDFAPK